ncbi:nuclear transport factor 2 family protein [Sphingopyxis lindanitolerans]|nr:nuclear transport factor 2 family protein [Sphingopyxis lindanitolerans]
MTENLIRGFFAAADSLDEERFLGGLPEDIVWRFGNFPVANGREAVREQYRLVTGILTAMYHDIVGMWAAGDCVTAETRVHYTDRHGRKFEFPGCDIIFLEGGQIKEVRIFVDNHTLFIPPTEEYAARAAEEIA